MKKMISMKRLLTIAALSFTTLSLTSCLKDYGPGPYQPPYTPQSYTYAEEFNNNNDNWSFADPANYAYGVVSNGTFKFDYNDNYMIAYYVSKNINFNSSNDFTIYTRIGSNNNMGLLFGYNKNAGSYGYSFTVSYDGVYALYDEGGNGYGNEIQAIVQPTTANFVNKNGDWNDLRLEQRNNKWYGYINNVLAFEVPAERLRGTNVGFVNVPYTQGEADYLQVDWWE
jgi:hypothetical protein